MKPLLHVFGHVHAGRTDFEGRLHRGRERVIWDRAQTALQSGLNRRARGLLLDLFNHGLWWDLGRPVGWACWAVLRERIWDGGETLQGGTLMVNAALMYEGMGRMGNEVQVIEI